MVFLRQNNGGIVLCAVFNVELWPVTEFSRILVKDLVGSENGGRYLYRGELNRLKVEHTEDYNRFHGYAKQIVCNSEGHAKFSGISDGEYYIHLAIAWQVFDRISGITIYEENGGYLFDRVRVSGGQTLEHTLTR
ncbi:MAG: hypothetical protein LBQ12_11935 [Deltaproteobacteria bacterium]|jgi:hypothetical protein|nr:hypothetical protein [Deltaproteobacteria bacterium]